jgi:hypothetical protein
MSDKRKAFIMSLGGRNMTQLKQIAEINEIEGYKKMRKLEIIKAIVEATAKNIKPEPIKEKIIEPVFDIIVPDKVELPVKSVCELPIIKPEIKPVIKPEIKPVIKPEIKPVIKPEIKPVIKPEIKPEPEVSLGELEDMLLTKEDKEKKFLDNWERKVQEKMKEFNKSKKLVIKKEKLVLKLPRGINLKNKYILEEIIDQLELLENKY